MSNEQVKINEARYFLEQLPGLREDREKFAYTVSAFLSAARSALQYAWQEAKDKNNLGWYDGQVAGKSVVKFFKKARNINIHAKPVSPIANLNIHVGDPLKVSESVLIATLRADGTLKRQYVAAPAWSSDSPPDVRLSLEYFFTGWQGLEDVINLCQIYLQEIQRIVADGVAKGFLTP